MTGTPVLVQGFPPNHSSQLMCRGAPQCKSMRQVAQVQAAYVEELPRRRRVRRICTYLRTADKQRSHMRLRVLGRHTPLRWKARCAHEAAVRLTMSPAAALHVRAA